MRRRSFSRLPGSASDDGGFDGDRLSPRFWLGLAASLLVVASSRVRSLPQPYGVFLYERRSVLALIGVNMLAVAAICYLVVATA